MQVTEIPCQVVGRMEVHDNWFVVRAPDGRLLAAGRWMPPTGLGVEVLQVSAEQVREALAELAGESINVGPVASFDMTAEG